MSLFLAFLLNGGGEMGIPELLFIAIALSMDAFAVSVCTGLSMQKPNLKNALIVGLYFGFFQAAMPLIGFLVGVQFAAWVRAIDHWAVFILLSVIGGKMLYGSFKKESSDISEVSLRPGYMLPLALATSIDALAVGVSFAFLDVNILPAVSVIGAVTLLLSAAGVGIGSIFGAKYKSKAELAGGIILILIGLKILLEHTGIISF